MTMIGTCGHDITKEWEEVKNGVSYMEFAIDYDLGKIVNAVAYGVICKKCLAQYKEWGIVLEDEQAEQDWMNGKLAYPNDA